MNLKLSLVVAGFVSSVALAQTATGDVTGVSGWVDLLKSGGPFSVAAIAGWLAYRKDTEAKESQKELVTMAQKTQGEMIQMVSNLTQTLTKMEDTLDELKEAVRTLKE